MTNIPKMTENLADFQRCEKKPLFSLLSPTGQQEESRHWRGLENYEQEEGQPLA